MSRAQIAGVLTALAIGVAFFIRCAISYQLYVPIEGTRCAEVVEYRWLSSKVVDVECR